MAEAKKTTLRSYSQIKNPLPAFVIPKKKGTNQDKATLPFNKKLMQKAKGLTARFEFAIQTAKARALGKRQRKPPVLRRQAIEALLQAICFHYDPLANRVNATLTTLAIECSLTTESDRGNLSITRATRALYSLAKDFGLLTYSEPKFDPELGCNIPTDITFTRALFEALDISEEAVNAARRSRAEWKNQQREQNGFARLELVELIPLAWQAFNQRFKQYRLKCKTQGEKRARARRDVVRTHQEIRVLVRRELTREIAEGRFPVVVN